MTVFITGNELCARNRGGGFQRSLFANIVYAPNLHAWTLLSTRPAIPLCRGDGFAGYAADAA
jgi:hypothetical protein